jgi:ABC-2 type transport system permease protein
LAAAWGGPLPEFRLELWSHLSGFLVMTVVTAAVGGSMFPRFAMSEGLRTAGLFTFNAWALDGYQKVFWRDTATWELWPAPALRKQRLCPFALVNRRHTLAQ